MRTSLRFEILPQPSDTTCGPTCLHAVYRYYGDPIGLEEVIREAPALEEGGTLAVLLASHALRRGYRATIYTYNLQVFDPTWFAKDARDLEESLRGQMDAEADSKLKLSSKAYIDFLELGGKLRFEDLTAALVRRFLNRGVPILTGLSATYLYRCPREVPERNVYDDLRGKPSGHFVVLSGYDRTARTVMVADPYLPNPVSRSQYYEVAIERIVCSILLGIVTYDANLLIVEPTRRRAGPPHALPDRR